ncbi:MAG: hypothetical protein NTV88_05825 [Candidatus Micrarchaeota archaeon]|nr:hypothetical protein [Candidatus Micrarchaeota archaeon]
MAKEKSVDEITADAIHEGGYLVNLYFDLHGGSEEAVKNIMVGFIGKLTKEPGVVYAVGEIDKPEKKEDLFSTWAQVKLLAQDFHTLTRISIQYSPIGIEILRPSEVNLTLGQAQSMLLDVSQASQNFTRVIMERTLSALDRQEYAKKMEQRIELGKKLMEKSHEKK